MPLDNEMQERISGTAYTNARRCKSLQLDQTPEFTPVVLLTSKFLVKFSSLNAQFWVAGLHVQPWKGL